jgi:hypothetical protein
MHGITSQKEEQTRQGLWSSLISSLYQTNYGESITHFKDEIEKNKVSLTIKHCRIGMLSLSSFIFEKNLLTGKVDLDYCSRTRNEKDQRKMFRNCTQFRTVFDEIEGTAIELTSELCDSSFYLYSNFKRSHNLGFIVNSINRLIETVLNEDVCGSQPQLDLIQESFTCQPSSPAVFPLCHILYRDREIGATSVTREYNLSLRRYEYTFSSKCFAVCTNYVSNYAEAEFYTKNIMTAYATD